MRLNRFPCVVVPLLVATAIMILRDDREATAKPPKPVPPPLPSYSIHLIGLIPGQTISEALGMND